MAAFRHQGLRRGARYFHSAYLDLTIRSSVDRRDGTGLRTIATGLGDVSMARLDYSAHIRLLTVPDGDLDIFHVISGRYSLHHDEDEHRISRATWR